MSDRALLKPRRVEAAITDVKAELTAVGGGAESFGASSLQYFSSNRWMTLSTEFFFEPSKWWLPKPY
jgi:hypothetical protein